MCRVWLPPPNVPYLRQAPHLYEALALACLCFTIGWLLVWLNRRRPAQIGMRMVWYNAALGSFAVTFVLLIIAFIGWSRLEASWYFAYHTVFVALHCDPARIVQADVVARLTHAGLLLSSLAAVTAGLVLTWRGRQTHARALHIVG